LPVNTAVALKPFPPTPVAVTLGGAIYPLPPTNPVYPVKKPEYPPPERVIVGKVL